MKKFTRIILCTIIFIILKPAFAKDIPEDTIAISGDLDLSLLSLEFKPGEGVKREEKGQKISASALYYFAENIGVGFGWEYEKNEISSDGSKISDTSSIIGPAISYNKSIKEDVSVQVLGAIIKYSAENTPAGGKTSKSSGLGWSVGVGMYYFLTNSVALNASLTYVSITVENDELKTEEDATGFSSGIGLSIYIE